MRQRIVTLGGGGFSMESTPVLDDFILSLSRSPTRPRVCFVPTASGDSAGYVSRFRAAFPPTRAEASVLELFDRSILDIPAFLASQDVIYVGGGSTPNLLAVWRLHGVDTAILQALDEGVVLAGVSAGLNCWFEASLTDAFAGLSPLRDGLGVLPGSGCPHYHDGYRNEYLRLVAAGVLPAGYAVDDSCALLFEDGKLADAIASVPMADAYRVQATADGVIERPIDVRLLSPFDTV
ncbi:peptidase E [Nocardia sp. NPDC051030]|uniref:Type 1 glutamine amidotransferase-like domain-containing protein n=1 Tax=Nocardia sp. NPDC051030 TaxID=3155162 RepID=UPI003448B5DA